MDVRRRRSRIAPVLGVATAALMVIAAEPAQAQVSLTGGVVYSSENDGTAVGGQVWNTIGGDEFYNVYFSYLADGNNILNPNGQLNVALSPGLVTLYMFGAPGYWDFSTAGINLFFGNSQSLLLSAVVGVDGNTAWAPTSSCTLLMDGSCTAGADPWYIFGSGSYVVNLEGVSWNRPGSYDYVAPRGTTRDGFDDYVGRVTLRVTDTSQSLGVHNATATPEPISMVLLGTGLAGVAGVARRRRRKGAETE